jgi:hypothetical protein
LIPATFRAWAITAAFTTASIVATFCTVPMRVEWQTFQIQAAFIAPVSIPATFKDSTPIIAGGLLYDSVSGAQLFDSVTGSPIFA